MYKIAKIPEIDMKLIQLICDQKYNNILCEFLLYIR